MQPTVESWSGAITDIGPIYPMVGSEMILVWITVAAWIVWHIVQAKRESEAYEEQERRFGDARSLQSIIDDEDPSNP